MQTLRFAPFLAAAVLAGPATSQEKGTTTQASADTALSPAKKFDALKARFEKQQNDVYEAYAKAPTEEEKAKVWATRPGKEYVPEFRAVAEEANGTDVGAQAWLWVMRLSAQSDPKQAGEAVETLLSHHMQTAAMEQLANELRYGSPQYGESRVVEALRAIVSESPHERARAAALYTLGAVLLESEKAESKTEGRDCFEAVITEYGALSYGGSSNYKVAAEGFLYELDHLQIGMAAPDFQTVDENGAPWKLSDYRGKVVVVDFWGNW